MAGLNWCSPNITFKAKHHTIGKTGKSSLLFIINGESKDRG